MRIANRGSSVAEKGLEDRIENSTKQIKRNGDISKEGFEAPELSEEEIYQLNEKWVYWTHKLKPTIRFYASDDEDLIQEGVIALRKTLSENIYSPAHHLLKTAKYAILNAYSKGISVDSRKSETRNQLWRRGGIELVYLDAHESYDKSDLVSLHTYSPEILVIDKIAYKDFRKSLSSDESFLLELMIQTTGNGRSSSIYRKIFMHETNSGRWHYEKVSKELRQKFYFHFGTEYEQERFETLYSKMLKNNSQVEYRIQNTMKNGLNY